MHDKIKNIGLKTVRKKPRKKRKNKSKKRQNQLKTNLKKSQRKPPKKPSEKQPKCKRIGRKEKESGKQRKAPTEKGLKRFCLIVDNFLILPDF